ncbi:hypothetical protein LTR35_016539 [Friedmanniomyces endolithicus]|uniref:F-box domain-containing protein n=1 Tax=Friedmanniomyces endolithicus TaxID=329885 RepID=A0AAN6J5D6_9PEZI|nr:hypothetical protein LTR35_016539 [Friedmanniomyces endolithicus]KAK0273811.1 hypothetical protein LTS00_015661 [Friedmanniomyces endolithicus]KAK0306233.1 hypothetical protein LTR82_016448 [Friedmanniomyces endolithicus]KAK0978022.1 hypothetical protein LTR54_016047 [Friedmanniomyces endolithicus]
MALDQQRNWDISMAENLHHVLHRHNQPSPTRDDNATTNPTTTPPPWTSPPPYLPTEILLQILSHISALLPRTLAQTTLASCALLSHQWHAATLPLLYAHPRLYGQNFDPFVRAICPSINLHVRPSPLAKLVKSLNMASMVHQVSRTSTARLLGRTKEGLEEFVAPQASFAINCLPALGKCGSLRTLDLSLVSESPPLSDLFRTLERLGDLRVLRLPRSAGFGVHHKATALVWPPRLEELCLSGGIDAHFLHGVVAFPGTLRGLTIEHCPLAKGFALVHLLRTAVRPLRGLESLKIRHMPRLSSRALDDVLFLLPQLKTLSVSVDYITPAIFDEGHYSHLAKEPLNTFVHTPSAFLDDEEVEAGGPPSLQHHALHTLELTSSGNTGIEDKISPIDLLIAMDEGCLPNLRRVRVAKSLHWHNNVLGVDTEALGDALREKWEEKKEGVKRDEEEAGVWLVDG